MKWSLFLCVMLALLLGCGCSSSSVQAPPVETPSVPVSSEDLSEQVQMEGNHITAQLGQTFTIEIPGNITTGFIWRQTKDNASQSIVTTVGEDYRSEKSKIPVSGAPGTHFFKFRAKEVGECILRFEYLRPWETDDPLVETKEYHITVISP